jgi:hypothetical protein
MDDSKLRDQFVNQTQILRSKIFKKVKVKNVNGTPLNGEMLLELCTAYTNAINQGTVPCLESAWTYVCQNECQRALQSNKKLSNIL